MAGLEPAIFRSEVCCLIQLGHMVWDTVVKYCCQCVRLRKYVILVAIRPPRIARIRFYTRFQGGRHHSVAKHFCLPVTMAS